MDKSFLVLFFKKELLAIIIQESHSQPIRITAAHLLALSSPPEMASTEVGQNG
jgi:hypothetical protein